MNIPEALEAGGRLKYFLSCSLEPAAASLILTHYGLSRGIS